MHERVKSKKIKIKSSRPPRFFQKKGRSSSNFFYSALVAVVVRCEAGVGVAAMVIGPSVQSGTGSGGTNRPPRVLPTNTDLDGNNNYSRSYAEDVTSVTSGASQGPHSFNLVFVCVFVCVTPGATRI